MRTLACCVILLALVVPAAAAPKKKHECGVERWPVKTLADSGAIALEHDAPRFAKIADLVKVPAPTRKELLASPAARFVAEKKQFFVYANLTGYKLEADGDFHLVLESDGHTMVAEIPSPECTDDAQLESTWASEREYVEAHWGKATAKFRHIPPVPIAVSGFFFYDFIHGQTGVAPNGAEIHPVMTLSTE